MKMKTKTEIKMHIHSTIPPAKYGQIKTARLITRTLSGKSRKSRKYWCKGCKSRCIGSAGAWADTMGLCSRCVKHKLRKGE